MLILSLFLSLAVLGMAHVVAWRPAAWSMAIFIIAGVVVSIGPLCVGIFFLPPVALLFVLLLVALGIWHALGRRRYHFPALSCAATAAAFGIIGWYVWDDQTELARLREEFPYQSMEERLPETRPGLRQGPLSDAALKRLSQMEDSVASQASRTCNGCELKQLHEDTVWFFINSPGFGVARIYRPSRERLTSWRRSGDAIPQPGPVGPSFASSDDGKWQLRAGEEDLHTVHEIGVVDFANPENFGFIKDRRHVAGFQAHQFSRVPEPARRWAVETVDLVGLLLHDEPVVYISANLPHGRVTQVADPPTGRLRGGRPRPVTAGRELGRRGNDRANADAGGGPKHPAVRAVPRRRARRFAWSLLVQFATR